MRSARIAALVAVAAVFAALLPMSPAQAGPTDYVVLSDGIQIAINVRFPDGSFGIDSYEPKSGKTFPAIFEMSGYDGGSADGDTPGDVGGEGSRGITAPFNDDYVTIHASVRGTGCSGGEFDLFSYRSALDGYELIEWINDQPWSNGKIAIYGHSYGGITGTMVASTRPPSLDAITVSGLIDDLYRGIVYPGGVSNYGFPLLWTGIIRNVYDIGGGSFDGAVENQDPVCAANTASHTREVLNDPIVQGLKDTDNEWFRSRSLINYIDRIEVPTHFTGAFNDEQTGPRGPYHLFEHLDGDIPRRLVQTNGDHGTQTNGENQVDRKAWVDHWLGVDRDVKTYGSWPNGKPHVSVLTRFDTVATDQGQVSQGQKLSTSYPLEDTEWTDYYLHSDGSLDREAPAGPEPTLDYVSGSPRQAWSYQAGDGAGPPLTTESAPDELEFATEGLAEDTAVVGPITATLYASLTAVDTEFFVQVIDEAPDGSRYYLTRGLLKASHRAVTGKLSDKISDGPRAGEIYRPHRPHTNPTNVVPGEVNEYLIEVFPTGHIFRKGHKLVVKVHTPPLVDSYYAYVPKRIPGINTIHFGSETPSRLMFPIVSLNGVDVGPEPAPCTLYEVRCIP
jgi:putative CocE/NonD family hydrolase